MNKLLSVLLAGFFAAGAAMAQTSTPTPSSLSGSGASSGSVSGSLSGSSSTDVNSNTNTATSNNANLNNNTNTNTNFVNVYGPGSNRLARQQQATQPSSTGVSMLPGRGNRVGSASPSRPDTRTAGNNAAHSSTWCPPGLAKKDNGCMPPGLTR